jgi:hypothetical protein
MLPLPSMLLLASAAACFAYAFAAAAAIHLQVFQWAHAACEEVCGERTPAGGVCGLLKLARVCTVDGLHSVRLCKGAGRNVSTAVYDQ